MKKYVLRTVSIILVITVSVIIFCFSAQPAKKSTKSSNFVIIALCKVIYPDFEQKTDAEKAELCHKFSHPIRKLAHFSLYAVLGIFSYLSFYWYEKIKFSLRAVYGFAYAVIYAVSDEIHQMFVPGRACQIKDVIIDSSGAACGILILMALIVFLRKRRLSLNGQQQP